MGELIQISPPDVLPETHSVRELARRSIGTLSCGLWYNTQTGEPFICLKDKELDVEFIVPRHQALDAFYHPHAYRPNDTPNAFWDTPIWDDGS